ncbi:MAG TPA: Crp/Fnr family transcriptional regulator [Candidatus Scatomonas merdigallinarum]|nr:Crp/Fnr family transcriptional regulator [Candidatus Scatomonas merdigallinarum]
MDFVQISKTVLFQGTRPEDAEAMLKCLEAREKQFQKDETIYYVGDRVSELGLVLSGSVLIENDDLWGNRSILDRIGPGQIFAETYACVPGEKLLVTVTAAEKTEVLFLNVGKILRVCTNACSFHARLIRNLLTLSARKNLNLSRRIFHTSAKSIRGRLLSYLSWQAVKQGSREFDIPFNRQQLADYLGVDRSAMSAELGKMKREGLIQVDRSHFRMEE